MIRQTATAIIQKFNSDSNLQTLLAGGLHFHQAPQNVSSPWGTFFIISVSDDEIMGTSADVNLREVEIQISLFSKSTDGGEEISLISELFADVFDWTDLRVGGYSIYKVQRMNLGPITISDEIWQSDISYTIGMTKE